MPQPITLTQEQIDAVKAIISEHIGDLDLDEAECSIHYDLNAMRAPSWARVEPLEDRIVLAVSEDHTGCVSEAREAVRKMLAELGIK